MDASLHPTPASHKQRNYTCGLGNENAYNCLKKYQLSLHLHFIHVESLIPEILCGSVRSDLGT